MPKSKKFIDKKSAVTFHLVHRSQHDPLVTDETAPQHVLVQSENSQKKVTFQTPKDAEKIKKEQKKYGIYFDDDYDYLQHLRGPDENAVHWEYSEPKNMRGREAISVEDANAKMAPAVAKTGGLVLPSSVFASEFEEDEGMLRKAAPRSGPRLDWDPDIVAALDDDFDFENPDNQLDDDFMAAAVGESGDFDEDDDWADEDDGERSDIGSDDLQSDCGSEEERDALGPLRMYADDDDNKSRFTEYSMSSSVIRRNEQLQLLDERFEKFFEKYDEAEVGALDCDEIEGNVELNEDLLSQCLVEFKRDEELESYNKQWDVERLRKHNAGEESSDEELMEVEDEERVRPFDCETILSTYSNIYNHPKLIEEPVKHRRPAPVAKIQINPKTGVPENVFHGENSQLTTKALAKLDAENRSGGPTTGGPKSLCAQSVLSTLSVLSIRPKDETPEEKRERKRLLKDYRSERRIERKANTQAFKEEKKQQERNHINNRKNIQGKTIV